MSVDHPRNLTDAHTEQPKLSGRKAIITGGTTGTGRAIAVLLASEGARVFVCGRTPDHLDDALARIREVGEGNGFAVDLTRRDEVERLFAEADRYLGGLDIAVINAAVPVDAIVETSRDDLYYATAADFTAYLATTQAAVSRMKGGSDVVLIGSMSAVSKSPGSSIYVAAKSGIEGFSMSLRKELVMS